jgi:hypothetical protein
MALGNLTYKTPNPINLIEQDLSSSEGCGVTLTAAATIDLATAQTNKPYGIIVVGGDSQTPGTYPSPIAAAAIEIVDSYGAVVQALAGTGGVAAGDLVSVDATGGFITTGIAVSDYVWGMALTDAAAGEQFLLRFTPYLVFSLV